MSGTGALTPFQKRKLTRRFHIYDRRRTGSISWADIVAVLENVIEQAGHERFRGSQHDRFILQAKSGWQLLAASADVNGDGEVSLEEWLDFYAREIFPNPAEPGAIPAWLDALIDASFELMDTNGDGVISMQEYHNHLAGYGTSTEHIEAALSAIDTNGDGVISRDEWRTLNHDFYLGDDTQAASAWLWGDVYRELFH